jgi:uncharacterized membrane protein
MRETSSRTRATPRWLPRPGPERALLCLGLAFGSALLVLTPPFQAPDEPAHFYRAFQVSEGGLLPEKRDERSGGWTPESLVAVTERFMELPFHTERKTTRDAIRSALAVPLDPAMRRFVGFENTSVQTPVPYMAQALGMRLARALGQGPLALMYFGRAANLLVSLGILWLAVRAAPVFRWVLVLLALMPMAVFQMASLSADASTNAIALLFTALVLRIAYGAPEVETRTLVGLFVAAVLLSLCKFVYSALLLLLLAVPPSRLGGPKRFLAVSAVLVGLCAAALGGWLLLLRDVYAHLAWVPDSDPVAQLRWIAAHPTQYAAMLFERFTGASGEALWALMVGRVLGWLDTPMPHGFIRSYQLALVGVALFDSRSDIHVGARMKLVALGAVCAGLVTVGTMLYVNGHAVGVSYVAEIQGRYLIPLSPLPLLALYNRTLRAGILSRFPQERILARACTAGLVAFVVFSSLLTCFVIARRYYT